MPAQALPSEMSPYEQRAWIALDEHWKKKAQRRQLVPSKVTGAAGTAGKRSRDALSNGWAKVGDRAPEVIHRASDVVLDRALMPTLQAAAHLLEVGQDWAAEAMDPQTVLEHHRAHGHDVSALADLRALDLEALDNFTRRMSLKWRTFGAVEGGALGALAFVPVVGTGVALTADVVLMQLLNTAVATQAMYSYGYNAHHPDERHMIDTIVRRAYKAQAPKAKVVRDAGKAYKATAARVRWSEQVRKDHRLMQAVEKLMNQAGSGKVSISDVSKKMPAIGIVTSAGMNAYVLGDVAKQGVLYGRTRFLAEKYQLPLPANLRAADGTEARENLDD